ncbi:MAG: glycosyltransferase family 4 protein [Planctomycetes bacterium]|nr:glycosyltransferase family 4 protein [Planctomycetota bacterium]
MRLTIINQFYVPDISPTAHLAASLAEHRARRGDRVTVVTGCGGYVPVAGSSAARGEENPRIMRIWTPGLGKRSLWRRVTDYATFYLLAAARVLTLPPQDVIVSLTTPPFIACVGALVRQVRRRTRLVLWSMDCYPDVVERAGIIRREAFAGRAMRAINRALFRRLDHLVCLDSAMRDLLLSQYVTNGRILPTSIIPNWERADFFPADARPGAWKGREDPALRGRFIVLYLGNAGTGHQFETVFDAAERLRGEPIAFLFVGGGSGWSGIEQAVRRRMLDNVVVHGYVPKEETLSVMAAADCALITLRDSMLGVMSPSKLHSSLAMGLPILYVGPEESNVDEAIRRFGVGASLRHGQADRLVAFVRRLKGDAQARQELRGRARRAFEEAYCDLRTLPQFDAVLDGRVAREDHSGLHGRQDAL